MRKIFLFLLAGLFWELPLPAQNGDSPITVSGLVLPRDDNGIYVRNSEGQFEVEWTGETEFALDVNTRLLSGLKDDILSYRVQAASQVLQFPVPRGPISAVVRLRNAGRVEQSLEVAEKENWIPEFGIRLHFDTSLKPRLPTAGDPRFVGLWDPTVKPRTLTIDGHAYEVSLKKGGQTNALLFNVIGAKACQPFVNRARITGRKKGDVIRADEIHLLPIGDQAASDDHGLPRYLFIGDSISGNYNNGLRKALAGKANIHHPPTNCGPSGKGKNSIVQWLGAYDQPDRDWDVISFNFGHWDAGNDKATYQANLESVISQLEKTKARLIWVSTCPVPRGFPLAGKLTSDGKAPRRTSGVMEKYLNPWALEVIQRHPAISICDQWQFVKDHDKDLYQQWWTGKNVHFDGKPADALGQLLAEHVASLLDIQISR